MANGDKKLSEAMKNADAAEEVGRELAQTVQQALEQKTMPVFNTHSVALAGEMRAKGDAIKALVEDVDARIAALQSERTDLMLAYSMLSKGMRAREEAS